MSRVAFATHRESPELTDDDRMASDVLRGRGVGVHPVAWDAPDVDWGGFDLVVIRSTWDYHLKAGVYAEWLRSFLPGADRLWNPPAVVLGNLNKRYLIELARRGVDVVPTAYVGAGDGQRLRALIERSGWNEVVVKPAIAASGPGAWRSSLDAAGGDQARFVEEIQTRDLLVQPYVPEIASSGEWSLVFFDGGYSHAVLKRPADGDFRVQRHFGGRPAAAT